MIKMLKCIIYFSFLNLSALTAQYNFNYIIPFNGLPNPQNFVVKDSFCYISSINFVDGILSSTILEVNLNNGITVQNDLKRFAITRAGIIDDSDKLIIFGDYASPGGRSIHTTYLNENIEIVDSFIMDEAIVFGGATAFSANDSLLFGIIVHDEEINGDLQRKLRLLKISPDLDSLIIDTLYNEEIELSYGWKSILNSENELIVSVGISGYNHFYRYPQLLKLDEFGNILMDQVKDEPLADFGGYIPICILNNEDVIQAYEIDKRSDVDFIINDWFIEPTRINKYDNQGELLLEKLLITDYNDVPRIYNLISGQNSNFYCIGSIENIESELIHGLIIKLDSNLDTIWSGQYQHPDFNEENIYHEVIDIKELDDGGLMILAFILVDFFNPKLWLFTVDEFGNQTTSTVDEVTIDGEIGNHKNCLVYPNPAVSKIKFDPTINKPINIKIYNQNGTCVLRKENYSQNEVEIEWLPSGLYFVILEYSSTIKETCIFIKR